MDPRFKPPMTFPPPFMPPIHPMVHAMGGLPPPPMQFRPPQVIQSAPQINISQRSVTETILGKPPEQMSTVYVGKIPPGVEDEFVKKLLEFQDDYRFGVVG